MKRGASNLEVKKLNRNQVFRYINERERTSMPEIAAALSMSMPTVLKIINELKDARIVREDGELESTGGRKAGAVATVKNAKYALGLDITKNHVGIVYTDLSGQALCHERIRKPFVYSAEYLLEVAAIVSRFAGENRLPRNKILGIGIAIPGIIDGARNHITYSHALDIYNIPGMAFTEVMPYPGELLNDANAAAIAESNMGQQEANLVYLFLSNTVGGAIMFGDETGLVSPSVQWDSGTMNIYKGSNWHSGEFGHMVIRPEGRRCYCGKQGCLDAYCSALRLSDQTAGDLNRFFAELEAGRPERQQAWEEYLKNLAIAVDNLRMCFDCDIVLGGYVGCKMEPYLMHFRELVAAKNIFKNDGSYVRACRYHTEATALGAAIYQIEKYMESI